jgi:hypothetical protein
MPREEIRRRGIRSGAALRRRRVAATRSRVGPEGTPFELGLRPGAAPLLRYRSADFMVCPAETRVPCGSRSAAAAAEVARSSNTCSSFEWFDTTAPPDRTTEIACLRRSLFGASAVSHPLDRVAVPVEDDAELVAEPPGVLLVDDGGARAEPQSLDQDAREGRAMVDLSGQGSPGSLHPVLRSPRLGPGGAQPEGVAQPPGAVAVTADGCAVARMRRSREDCGPTHPKVR